jgi:hypothetical protein
MAAKRYRVMDILNIMKRDTISTPEKKVELREQLAIHFDNPAFLKCQTMGELVKQVLRYALRPHLSRIQKNLGKITD